jgi:hypothetical protein
MTVKKPYLFISHSTKDKGFTEFLAGRLREASFNVWVDVDSIPDGSTWLREIERAVRSAGAMIVVMSRSGRDSEWVERETLLAMDLRKPLFIALIDDIPMPLHLINRQYTDFREDEDAAAQHLVSVLKEISLTQPDETDRTVKLSPEPDEGNFFAYLEQLSGGEHNADIARDLYAWGKRHVDGVAFGGKITPGFHARLKLEEDEITLFSLWAYPRQPAVQVNMQSLSAIAPYTDRALRRSTLESLNQLLPDTERHMADKAERRPTFPLSAFDTADGLETFKQILAEIIDNLRAG